MLKRKVGLGISCLVIGLSLSGAGCETLQALVDPTANMTPEEKEAYYARKQAEREAYQARQIQDLTTPGEAHDETISKEMVGRWGHSREENWITPVLFKGREKGKRRWSEDYAFFDNGSYAYRLNEDKRWGDGWEVNVGASSNEGRVQRGQWKVVGDKLFLRLVSGATGYGSWQSKGAFEVTANGRQLAIVNTQAAEAKAKRLPEGAPPEEALQIIAENMTLLNRR